jgi:hypothetical protein
LGRSSSFFLALLLSTAIAVPAQADQTGAKTLFDALFNGQLAPTVGKIVVYRVDPNIMRVVSISPGSFDRDKYPFQGDSQAMITGSASISEMLETLHTTPLPKKEGCYGTTFTTPKRFYVSWAVFFYGDQYQEESGNKRLATIFLTRDGDCVSTGTQVYQVDPQTLAQYLSRTFAFMNF